MKKNIRSWLLAILFVTSVGGVTFTLATPQPTYAACSDRLLTFPAWYKGLTNDDCSIKSPKAVGSLGTFVWRIVLNILELTLQLVAYISVGFIIRGGFKYMTAIGESADIEKAKLIIKNAIVGLIISIFSVAIVNFVVGALG